MSESVRMTLGTRYRVRALIVAIIMVVASGCSESPVEAVEQIRQRHDDTMGHPVKITYELGSDWESEKWGRYSPVGLAGDDVSLYVKVDSARYRGDDFAARLAELKKGPANGRKRERMIAHIITLDEQPAVEFAMRQQSSRDPDAYRVSHRFEFIRGDYYVEVRLNATQTLYERYVDQLRHTAASVELVTDK